MFIYYQCQVPLYLLQLDPHSLTPQWISTSFFVFVAFSSKTCGISDSDFLFLITIMVIFAVWYLTDKSEHAVLSHDHQMYTQNQKKQYVVFLKYHTYTLAHKHTSAHIHARMHTHTHTCMHACTHACMNARTHARTHAHTHTHSVPV